MPLPPVVVDIVADDAKPELVQALLSACSHAVADAQCVSVADADEAVEPTAVAIVSWEGDRRATIQVGLQQRQEWRSRQLDFADEDPPIERWKTVGLATGTLAWKASVEEPGPEAGAAADPAGKPDQPPESVQEQPPVAKPLPPASPPKDAQSSTPPAVKSKDVGSSVRVDALATVAPAVIRPYPFSAWRIGGELRGVAAPPWPWPLGMVSVGYATIPEHSKYFGPEGNTTRERYEISYDWVTLGAGAGVALLGTHRRYGVDVRGEILVHWIDVAANYTAPDPGNENLGPDRPGRRVGPRVGVDISWMVTPVLGLLGGAELVSLWGDVPVNDRRRDQPEVEFVEGVYFAIVAGVRVPVVPRPE